MGLFGAVSSNWSKAQAAAIVQKILEQQARQGLDDGHPVALANKLVALAWSMNPPLFEGKGGPKPHKAAVAAFAFACGVLGAQHLGNKGHEYVYSLGLGLLMDELSKNAHLYPFHHIDHQLLERAATILAEQVEALEDMPFL